MKLWQSGNWLDLLQGSLTIQKNLKYVYKANPIDQISKKFVEKMQRGNVNEALKLLMNNMQHGILPLNEETILKTKNETFSSCES